MAKLYPTPCIRRADSPDGENFVYESPSGQTVPFACELDARTYVMDHKIHRKYGRVFVETAPKRFVQMIADDGGDEDESTDD
jgi:hypothetical protein